jgi:hypothetical protein
VAWTALVLAGVAVVAGCRKPSDSPAAAAETEPETLARTEFTDRVENFFEYEALKAGRPSVFRIHLTDLSDGSPVEKASVILTARRNAAVLTEATAKVGKVTGIYVAELNIPSPGPCDIEFRITNAKVDERLPLAGFIVE